MAHGRWVWPATDARCRRLRTFSLMGGTSQTGGALRTRLMAAATQWGVSPPAGSDTPRPSHDLELRLRSQQLLMREVPSARTPTARTAAWLPSWFSPPHEGSTQRTHVDVSAFGEAHAQEAHAQEAHAQEAHAQEAHAQEAHAQEAHAQEAHAQEAHAQATSPAFRVHLSRRLEGSGYHLAVESRATLVPPHWMEGEEEHGGKRGAPDSRPGGSDGMPEQCSRWAVLERLPAGAFFDPHQLRRLARRGALGGAGGGLVMGEVELETPAMESPQAVALVHGTLERTPTMGADGGEAWHVRSSVPLHLRYGAPTRGGETHRPVELPPPLVYVCCHSPGHAEGRDDANDGTTSGCPSIATVGDEWRPMCTSIAGGEGREGRGHGGHGEHGGHGGHGGHGAECGTWHRADVVESVQELTLRARVPVGQLERSDTVLMVTVLSLGAATLWLLWVLWRAPTPM